MAGGSWLALSGHGLAGWCGGGALLLLGLALAALPGHLLLLLGALEPLAERLRGRRPGG